jgi:GT2 family glycosyltransferase
VTENIKVPPHVAVVILNWNGWVDTLACLDSLLAQDYCNFSVVVVDNASSDGSAEKIQEWMKLRSSFVEVEEMGRVTFYSNSKRDSESLRQEDFVFIQAPSNGGFASGNNLGVRFALDAGADYVWLLNNDTELNSSSLSKVVAIADSDSCIGMCGSVLVYWDDRRTIQAVGGVVYDFYRAIGYQVGQGELIDKSDIQRLSAEKISYVAGAALLARSDFIREVGLMEERYFLYFEEVDWASRSLGRWKIATAPESIVYHKEGGSIGTSSRTSRSKLSQYYLIRNLLLFYWYNHRALILVAVMRSLRELFNLVYDRNFHLIPVSVRAIRDACMLRSGKAEI